MLYKNQIEQKNSTEPRFVPSQANALVSGKPCLDAL